MSGQVFGGGGDWLVVVDGDESGDVVEQQTFAWFELGWREGRARFGRRSGNWEGWRRWGWMVDGGGCPADAEAGGLAVLGVELDADVLAAFDDGGDAGGATAHERVEDDGAVAGLDAAAGDFDGEWSGVVVVALACDLPDVGVVDATGRASELVGGFDDVVDDFVGWGEGGGGVIDAAAFVPDDFIAEVEAGDDVAGGFLETALDAGAVVIEKCAVVGEDAEHFGDASALPGEVVGAGHIVGVVGIAVGELVGGPGAGGAVDAVAGGVADVIRRRGDDEADGR